MGSLITSGSPGLGRPYRAIEYGHVDFPGRCPGLSWAAPLGLKPAGACATRRLTALASRKYDVRMLQPRRGDRLRRTSAIDGRPSRAAQITSFARLSLPGACAP